VSESVLRETFKAVYLVRYRGKGDAEGAEALRNAESNNFRKNILTKVRRIFIRRRMYYNSKPVLCWWIVFS